MRKGTLLLILIQISLINRGQIIADHTIVDRYDDIPSEYITEVKKMWLVYAGESHSGAIRAGLTLLESLYSAFPVSVVESGTPESYTTSNLRASRGTWGDLNNPTGWIYSYGEEDWFTSATAIERTKAGITYCNSNSLMIGAIGFGWCWDPGVSANDYLTATQEYIDYCSANGYSTKVLFTTGPVDNYSYEDGYNKSLDYEIIRTYAKANPSRILFDYADILCYNDDGTTNTRTWDGHTYPWITSINVTPTVSAYHISEAGAIRLAKAMWWLLARIAGWDGTTTTGINDSEKDTSLSVIIATTKEEIRIKLDDYYLFATASIYNLQGSLVSSKLVESDILVFDISSLPQGIYIVVLSNGERKVVEKVIKQ